MLLSLVLIDFLFFHYNRNICLYKYCKIEISKKKIII